MDWGYYCRTCGDSSESLFDELRSLWVAYREAHQEVTAKDPDDTIATTALDVRALVFLARHFEHDVWAECEVGVLRLSSQPKTEPTPVSALPQRFVTAIQ